MSPTVRALLRSAASDEEDVEPGDDAELSGVWRWITVVVLPLSIAPVASRTAPTTATTRPPTTPATKLVARRFIRRDGRTGLLIRRKPCVRRQGDEPSQARDRPRALGQGAPQSAPVARGRWLGVAGRGVALLAQQADVARGIGPGRDLQAPLELRHRGARGIDVAEPRQGVAQLLDGPLRATVEVWPPAQDRRDPEQGHRQRHDDEQHERE